MTILKLPTVDPTVTSSRALGLGSVRLSAGAERDLLEHPWPGNIRELDNVLHRALLVFHGDEISSSDLRLSSLPKARSVRPDARADDALELALVALFEQGGSEVYNNIEERVMRAAYHFCHRNQVQTAKLLGISRNIMRARLIQYGDIAGTPRHARVRRLASVGTERGSELAR